MGELDTGGTRAGKQLNRLSSHGAEIDDSYGHRATPSRRTTRIRQPSITRYSAHGRPIPEGGSTLRVYQPHPPTDAPSRAQPRGRIGGPAPFGQASVLDGLDGPPALSVTRAWQQSSRPPSSVLHRVTREKEEGCAPGGQRAGRLHVRAMLSAPGRRARLALCSHFKRPAQRVHLPEPGQDRVRPESP